MREAYKEFSRPAQVSIAAPAVAYLAAAAYALPHSRLLVDAGLVIIFAAAAAVKPIPHPLGGIKVPNVSVIIVSTLLWSPAEVMLGVGIGTFLGLLMFRKNEVWRAALNMHMWGLPAGVAAVVAQSVIAATSRELLDLAVAALLAVATYRVANNFLFAWYRSTRFNLGFFADWFENTTAEASSALLSTPLAVALAAVTGRKESVVLGLALNSIAALGLPLARQEFAYYTRAQQMLDQIVEAVVRALEGLNPAARAHGDRVSALAVEVGRRVGLSQRALLTLRLASRLHELGPLASSESSSPDESRQAAAGGRILSRFPDPAVAKIVGSLRSRWDGKGTPERQRGSAIPLEARVLAAVDIYSSVVEGRSPFRAPLSRPAATSHLISLAGTVLDPQVVMVLLQVTNEQTPDRAAV